jgi:hypothetical protein
MVLLAYPAALVAQSYNFDMNGEGVALDGIFTIGSVNSDNAPYTSRVSPNEPSGSVCSCAVGM